MPDARNPPPACRPGPDHVLPTGGAARDTGGLSVHKLLKTVTLQRVADTAVPELARGTAVISRAERMLEHALTAEARLDTFARRSRAATS